MHETPRSHHPVTSTVRNVQLSIDHADALFKCLQDVVPISAECAFKIHNNSKSPSLTDLSSKRLARQDAELTEQ
jgi:hypothetical protein